MKNQFKFLRTSFAWNNIRYELFWKKKVVSIYESLCLAQFQNVPPSNEFSKSKWHHVMLEVNSSMAWRWFSVIGVAIRFVKHAITVFLSIGISYNICSINFNLISIQCVALHQNVLFTFSLFLANPHFLRIAFFKF